VSEATLGARTNGRLAAWFALVGTLTALNYIGRATTGSPDRTYLYTWDAFVGGVIQFAIMLGIVLWISAGGPARELLALRRPRSWARAVGIAAIVFVVTLAVSGFLTPFVDPGREQGLTPDHWDPSRAVPFVANAVVIAGFAPLVEELMFRGLGFSLLRRFGTPTAIVVTGVLFGPVHGLLYGLPILITFGLGLAYLRARSDSVYPCILLHGFFNVVALVASVTFSAGS
jgi:membrane protease YdiL (CAAX protease family)